MKKIAGFISAIAIILFFSSPVIQANTNSIISHGDIYRGINSEDYTYAESSTVHADGSNASSWNIYDNDPEGTISSAQFSGYTIDNNAIKLEGDGCKTGYRRIFDTPATGIEFKKQWSMKYSEAYTVYISCQTKDGHRYLYYTASNDDKLELPNNSRYVHHGLGTDTKSGSWITVRRNLQKDLKEAQPDNEIISVDAFLIRGSGFVDDLITLAYTDYDNDLIPDEIELNIPKLNYNDPSDADNDIDNDGLNNVKEIIFGTDINNHDTDQDGLNDFLAS